MKYFNVGHRLDVSAGLLDVRGSRNLISFDDVQLDVRGDVRLGAAGFGDRGLNTKLAAPNRLTLSAAQIYPVTRSGGIIAMGEYMVLGPQGEIAKYNPDAVLTLRRAAGDTPATPAGRCAPRGAALRSKANLKPRAPSGSCRAA
ncbi:hypothetical protein G6F66_014756 [Rhizopus arrhizus]|nr:hypothetical protein G6F66_014756 [Rhizopus arrhizus]